ncbi:MAG: hypothetical protein LBH04_04885 [Tannerellaceae bacterium]|jgi:uncharacterized protein (DUF2164 family)|nr:hypothetical protein [Tannerellaceae bacterium]
MDDKDLEIIHLKCEIDDLLGINSGLRDENAQLRRKIEEASDALYDIYRNL